MANRIKWSLIGIPDHQGVMNVGGRLGAGHGPTHLYRALKKMTGPAEIWSALQSHVDVESLGSDIEHNLSAAATAVESSHSASDITCVVGGGHDHGYSHLLGVKRAMGRNQPDFRIGCINIDAHLDLRIARPVASSGSPFRIAIERGVLQGNDLIEFGIQSHCNAAELWTYAKDQQIEIITLQELKKSGQTLENFKQSLKKLAAQVDAIVISLDLDAVAESHAPGVSAPQAEGFTSMEVISMMELAGSHPSVSSLGVFELNPLHDVDERTARLGATCVYHFVESALSRPPKSRVGRL